MRRLWRVAVPTGADLLAGQLSKLTAAPDLFSAAAHRGCVLVLCPRLDGVLCLTFSEASASASAVVQAAAQSAFACHSFGLATPGAAPLVAAQASAVPASLHALLSVAVGSEAAGAWWAELQRDDVLLPAVRRAFEHASAEAAAAAAAPDGRPRNLRSILTRACALLEAASLVAAVERGGGGVLPANLLRAYASARMSSLDGSVGPEGRPLPDDWLGMILSAGFATAAADGTVRLMTKGETRFPFPRRDYEAHGHLPVTDVAWLVREVERLDGPLPDDHPLWTVFDHLYKHQVNFLPSMAAKLAAAGGQLDLSGPAAAVPGPHHDKAVAKIEDLLGKGVVRRLTEEERRDPAVVKVVCQLKVVAKGKLAADPAIDAAVASRDMAALYAAVEAKADAVVDAMHARLAADAALSGEDALEAALASIRDPAGAKYRLVFRGDALRDDIHPFHFRFWGFPDFLTAFTPGAEYGKSDGAEFFYCTELDEASRPYFCGRYCDYWVQFNRLSMGSVDSPGVACLLSALICYIARRRGAQHIWAYVDDFLYAGARGTGEAQRTQADLTTIMSPKCANVPEQVSKRVNPGPCTELLGKELDTWAGTLSLPPEKAAKYMLHALVVRKLLAAEGALAARMRGAVTRASLRSLTGKLLWWASCAAGGVSHLHGLIKATDPNKWPLQLRAPMLADLDWWCARWARPGGLAPQLLLSADTLSVVRVGGYAESPGGAADASGAAAVASDAGDVSGGAISGGEAICHAWAPDEAARSTPWKEAKMVARAFRRWGPSWRGRVVIVLSDAKANAHVFNSGVTKSDAVAAVLREMDELAEHFGFTYVATWLPREFNQAADALTHCPDVASALAACSRLGLTLVA